MKPPAAPPEERTREMFFAMATPHVKRLYHVVRHLLAYREALGDVTAGELAVSEIVDGTLIRAYRDFVKHPPRRALKSWLVGLAREQVAAEVRGFKSWHEHTPVHTEDDVPEAELDRLGEEALDFYEPDEELRLGDLMPDLEAPSPDTEAESGELRWCVDAALAGLPREWREVLLLHSVEGLTGAELARVSGQPPTEVDAMLEHAREYVRQRLLELGCGAGERG